VIVAGLTVASVAAVGVFGFVILQFVARVLVLNSASYRRLFPPDPPEVSAPQAPQYARRNATRREIGETGR